MIQGVDFTAKDASIKTDVIVAVALKQADIRFTVNVLLLCAVRGKNFFTAESVPIFRANF